MKLASLSRRTVLGLTLAGCATLASASRPALAQEPTSRLRAEAYAACESKAQGNACSVEARGRTFQGICAPGRQEARLACRPSPPRPRS